MYIYQLTPAFYKNLSDKFNPVWLKKAELTSLPSKLGLNAELNRLVITCNAMIKHDYITILLHKEELLSSIHKRKCYRFLSQWDKKSMSLHIFFP